MKSGPPGAVGRWSGMGFLLPLAFHQMDRRSRGPGWAGGPTPSARPRRAPAPPPQHRSPTPRRPPARSWSRGPRPGVPARRAMTGSATPPLPVRAHERPAGHALADRPLEEPLPLEVQPARGRLSAGRRAASAQASSHSWNAQSLSAGVYVRKNRRIASMGSLGLPHQPRGQLESWRATCSNAAASTSSIESK